MRFQFETQSQPRFKPRSIPSRPSCRAIPNIKFIAFRAWSSSSKFRGLIGGPSFLPQSSEVQRYFHNCTSCLSGTSYFTKGIDNLTQTLWHSTTISPWFLARCLLPPNLPSYCALLSTLLTSSWGLPWSALSSQAPSFTFAKPSLIPI